MVSADVISSLLDFESTVKLHARNVPRTHHILNLIDKYCEQHLSDVILDGIFELTHTYAIGSNDHKREN